MLPLRYTLRSLGRRRLRTAMTIVGVALVVDLYATMSAVGDAMMSAFRTTGAAEEVVVQQTGALAADFSQIPRDSRGYLEALDGLAREDGRPLVSPELYLSSEVRRGGARRELAVRGVTGIAPRVYHQVELVRGEWPGVGRRAAIGRALAAKLGVGVGDELELERQRWTVVGLLDAGGRVYDQELWVDLEDLAATVHRTAYTGYTLRAVDRRAAAALVEAINGGRRFPVTAMGARDYYARAGGMAGFMAALGSLVALVVALGAVFGGMNTMYAAVAHRRQEIGVLRALGYRPRAILLAFLLESLLVGLAGGALGLLLAFATSHVPMEIPYTAARHYAIGSAQIARAMAVAGVVGVVGGCLPALRAARLRVVDALRATA